MNELQPDPKAAKPRRLLLLLLYVVAIGAGIKLGFDFGNQISGSFLLGIVGAINGALFCWLMVGMVAERLLRARPSPEDR